MMKQELDFSGREQLYYQIYDIMFQEIVNGKYAEKDLLPAESELMERYGVSRATVRRAMDLLKDEGLIEKKPGSQKLRPEDRRLCVEASGGKAGADKKSGEPAGHPGGRRDRWLAAPGAGRAGDRDCASVV